MIRVRYIIKFIDDFNKGRLYKKSRITDAVSEFIESSFQAIDDDLAQLQNNVNSGRYSNQDIFDIIQDIREKL